jgi:hypothetical protein
MPVTTIHDRLIDHPSAWTRRSIASKQQLIRDLTAEETDAIDRLLGHTRHLKPQEVSRAEFDDPVIAALMDDVRDVIMNGCGIVIVKGITPDRYSEEDFQRIYWGLGTHLGTAAVQSVLGDRLGYVQNKEDDPVRRNYRSLQELDMHTDSYEIVGLMCVRGAKSGGHSGLVSSLSIHNEILKTRPDLLLPLYEGFYSASEEARFSSKPVTSTKIPIYSCVGGVVSCMYEGVHLRNAAALKQVPLPPELVEALDYFKMLASREDMVLSFLLEAGEMMFWQNYTHLHSRTAFEDFPDKKRLLLRLWLSVPSGRPCHSSVKTRAETYERLHREAATASG